MSKVKSKTKPKEPKPRALTEHEKKLVAEMKEADALLSEFGLSLHGYDPGVTAYFKPGPDVPGFDTKFCNVMGVEGRGYWGEPIAFNKTEWKWLKPLLEELRTRRADAEDEEERERRK